MVITCGWCGNATELPEVATLDTVALRCQRCGHANPSQPWTDRGEEAPVAAQDGPGRPRLDPSQITQRLRIARKELGPDATNAELAEHLDISVRTLGRWLELANN